MTALSQDHLDAVSGGSPYSVGYTVGIFASDCLAVFIKMGSMYTPTL